MTTGERWGAAFASASTSGMATYDEVLVPRLFEPWAELLLDAVAPTPGEQVVDVACGPGSVARLAALRVGPTGRVTGCDLSPAMLAIARSKPPVEGGARVEYVECPAHALPGPDDAYDVGLCQQGLQFFPDRGAALLEIHRVLRPGGRLAVAVWRDIEECPAFAAIADALEAVLGAEAAAAYRGGPWGFTDPDELARLLEHNGFSAVRVERRELPLEFEDGAEQLVRTLAAAPVASRIAGLDDAGHATLVEEVRQATEAMTTGGVTRSTAAANVAVAVA